ncbi:hypothetical protein [Mycolicibacterium sp. CR10]|uniref:hypothetical protein n=1 Tax=Mycolicibacterium sp. CR10 TaxID=2562314 RepID=UPI0010BF6E5D|nr:hypothetical protein [Mycolicibacterium sp. CR10]
MTVASPHTVSTDTRTYGVVDDLAVTRQALLTGRATDAAGGPTPLEAVTVTGVVTAAPTDTRRFGTAAGRGGTFALTGRPASVFPELATTAFDVEVGVSAPGYLTTEVAVHIPAGTGLPVSLGDVALHRPGVRLVGRVTRIVAGNVAPVAGAVVGVVAPAGLIGLTAPMNFPHAPGDLVTAGAIAVAGPPLPLATGARRGDTVLKLLDRSGVVVGARLMIGSGPTLEYVVTDAVHGAANLARPGSVTLRGGLRFDHPAGSAQRVAFTASAANATVSIGSPREATLLRLTPPVPFADGDVVRIQAANPARVEYRVVRLPRDVTDADGRYAVGCVGTALTLDVQVVPPGGPPVACVLRFDRPDNVLDLHLP